MSTQYCLLHKRNSKNRLEDFWCLLYAHHVNVNFFLGKANRQWLYHPQLRTTLPPQDLVIDIVKSKCLEVMIGPHPYRLKPKISYWKVENDVLRLNVQVHTI